MDTTNPVIWRFNGNKCETCGSECVDNCLRCGAPQCCPKCCDEKGLPTTPPNPAANLSVCQKALLTGLQAQFPNDSPTVGETIPLSPAEKAALTTGKASLCGEINQVYKAVGENGECCRVEGPTPTHGFNRLSLREASTLAEMLNVAIAHATRSQTLPVTVASGEVDHAGHIESWGRISGNDIMREELDAASKAFRHLAATVAEANQELDRERAFDAAIHEGSKAMLRNVLGKDLWNTFWGYNLEHLCEAFDRITAERNTAQAENVRLREAFPTIGHPGGRLVKVVAHYVSGATQTIDGDVVTAALASKETPPT